MIVWFTHYMHGSKDTYYEKIEEVLLDHVVDPDDTDAANQVERIKDSVQFPFYEIGFECELDTETGAVKIVRILE